MDSVVVQWDISRLIRMIAHKTLTVLIIMFFMIALMAGVMLMVIISIIHYNDWHAVQDRTTHISDKEGTVHSKVEGSLGQHKIISSIAKKVAEKRKEQEDDSHVATIETASSSFSHERKPEHYAGTLP